MKQLTKEGVGTDEASTAIDTGTRRETVELWHFFVVYWLRAHKYRLLVLQLFDLRGGGEHRSLVREQFEVSFDQQGRFLRFREHNSKNMQGGIKQRKVQFKDLKIYARPDLGERCVVDVYNHYFGFVPKTGPFYQQPIGDNSKQVIGKNKFGRLVKVASNLIHSDSLYHELDKLVSNHLILIHQVVVLFVYPTSLCLFHFTMHLYLNLALDRNFIHSSKPPELTSNFIEQAYLMPWTNQKTSKIIHVWSKCS